MYYIALALFLGAVSFLVWINYGFKITERTLEYPSLPEEFNGFKIALISDLHNATFGKNNSRLVSAIKEIAPDAVAMAGDMHTSGRNDGEYLNFLSALCEEFPVYAVDGNHEKYWHTRDDYGEYLKKYLATGVKHLEGQSCVIRRGSSAIRIYGVGYHEYKEGCAEKDSDLFSIAILHLPEWFDQIQNKPDLMLSGHVHGGIIRLPGIGGLLAPGCGTSLIRRFERKYFFPKYSKDIYSEGNSNLAVSVGLGKASIQPFRFLRPEIMVITLKKGENQ